MWDLIVSVPDHCLSFYFVQNDKICSVTKYLYYYIFLRKRNLIIVFPVTNGTFDPVSVLKLM